MIHHTENQKTNRILMTGGGGGRRKMGAPPSNRSKERDEDLLLFREMHRRDKDRVVSLLQPVSDEFEPNGSYPLYGMASAKKGPGYGFHGESEKNDYDWLKTPPATPLFPSLEMEAKNPHEMVIQRELPIIQPLSRFAGKPEEPETNPKRVGAAAGRSKTPNPKPRIPTRSVTPSGRPSSFFTDHKKNIKNAPTQLSSSINRNDNADFTKKSNQTSVSKTVSERNSHLNYLAANLSKSMQGTSSSAKTQPKSRGVSPLVRSTIPAQIPGFSDETPPNLKTDRSTSASKVRPVSQSQSVLASAPQKPELSNVRARRQSCSSSVTGGRKVAPSASEENTSVTTNNLAAQKGSSRTFQTVNGGQILGSRMVDKLMNARKSSIEDKETKLKLNGSINEGSGLGRMISKSSLDVAVNHMVGTTAGRKSVSTNYAPSSKSSGGNHKAL